MATKTQKAPEKPANAEKATQPEESEYNGKPILCLTPGSRFPFQFGLGKARMILAHCNAI